MIGIVMNLKSFCQIANIYNHYGFSSVTDKHPHIFIIRSTETDRQAGIIEAIFLRLWCNSLTKETPLSRAVP